MTNKHTIGVVILAAGRGSRLKCDDIPKVMCLIGGRPIVSYIVDTLEHMGFSPQQISLVVGYRKEKVEEYFSSRVTFVHQTELKGTAHAAYVGMCALPKQITQVLVIQGDDSAFYTKESLEAFIRDHLKKSATVSLLSVKVDDPSQLGRVVRHDSGDVEVIEKEYVTPEQATINEVSTGTFMFDRFWYEEMFPKMPPLRKLGEYGLPTALSMVREMQLPYQVIPLEQKEEWFGVNTPEQLAEANKRKSV